MVLTSNTSLALDLAKRMQDPTFVKDLTLSSLNTNLDLSQSQRSLWSDLSLSNGYPGLVLFFSTLQRKGLLEESQKDVIHSYILKIKEAIETDGLANLSLFSGLSGICFAIQQASMEGQLYQPMLNTLHNVLIDNTGEKYLNPLNECLRQHKPIPSYLYDVISGMCGIGRYALENLSKPYFLNLVQNICRGLISLSQPNLVDGKVVPGWYLSQNDPLNVNKQINPKGNFNLGLAHGVTGILAFLAISCLKGVEVKGQREAIEYISDWICQKSFILNGMIRWPYDVTWEEEVEGQALSKKPSREAWCYGIPGIARSLFLAGVALKNEKIKTLATTAFRGIFCRPCEEWLISGPGLCHGTAGLLLITSEMAKEKGCEDILSYVSKLETTIFSLYNANYVFGFKDSEQSHQGEWVEINKPGFLEGTAGILLTLLTLSDPEPQWHLPFLIHG